MYLEKDIISHVTNENVAKSLWIKLETLYWQNFSITNYIARRDCSTFECEVCVSMNNHINDFSIISELDNIGEVLKDEDITLMLLNSLLDKIST